MPLGAVLGLTPGDTALDGDPAPSPTKRGTTATTFRPLSIVAKQLDESEYHLVQGYASPQAT